MMTDLNAPIYRRSDGSYVVTHHGSLSYGVGVGDESGLYPYSEVETYLAKHPEALVPEPLPSEPTPEDLAAAERTRAMADLAALDARAIRPLRAIAAGTATDGDRAELARIEAEAAGLRARLAG